MRVKLRDSCPRMVPPSNVTIMHTRILGVMLFALIRACCSAMCARRCISTHMQLMSSHPFRSACLCTGTACQGWTADQLMSRLRRCLQHTHQQLKTCTACTVWSTVIMLTHMERLPMQAAVNVCYRDAR